MHLKGIIKHSFMVLEDKLKQVLFPNEYLTLDELIDWFRDNILLTKTDGKCAWFAELVSNLDLATLLARYLYELKGVGNLKFVNQKSAMSSIIEYKLRKFAGRYQKVDSKNISMVVFDFSVARGEHVKEDFVASLTKLTELDYISPVDVCDLVVQLGIKLDCKSL